MSVFLVLGRWKQDCHKIKTSLGYRVRLSQIYINPIPANKLHYGNCLGVISPAKPREASVITLLMQLPNSFVWG